MRSREGSLTTAAGSAGETKRLATYRTQTVCVAGTGSRTRSRMRAISRVPRGTAETMPPMVTGGATERRVPFTHSRHRPETQREPTRSCSTWNESNLVMARIVESSTWNNADALVMTHPTMPWPLAPDSAPLVP